MTAKVLVLMLLTLGLSGGTAQAGPAFSLGRKTSCADFGVEVQLVFDQSAAARPLLQTQRGQTQRAQTQRSQQRAFPDLLRQRALAGVRVVTVLFGSQPVKLPKPLDFYLRDDLWWKAQRQGHLNAILLVGTVKGTPRVLYGVEGVPSDLDTDYGTVRSAVRQFGMWRSRQNPSESYAQAEMLLATTTRYQVAELARDYLCSANQASALARAFSAAKPNSPAAILAKQSPPICDVAPVDCSSW